MKKISLGVVACALATVMSAVSIPSYAAMPLPSPTVSRSTDVENVRDMRRFHGRHYSWRGDRGGYHTWRGHRGYRDYRPGYRRHSDGFWYPLAVFGAAAIIGNAVANQPRSHASWCAERYRSYRASDNTYQPTNGPRRQCR